MWIRSSRVQSRLDDYPLHSCSAQGNADGIRHYLQRGWSVTQRDADSFTPIHYAAKLVFDFLCCIIVYWIHQTKWQLRHCTTLSRLSIKLVDSTVVQCKTCIVSSVLWISSKIEWMLCNVPGGAKKRPEHVHALFSCMVKMNQHKSLSVITKHQRICVGIFVYNTFCVSCNTNKIALHAIKQFLQAVQSFVLLLVRRLCQNITVGRIISNWSAESAE